MITNLEMFRAVTACGFQIHRNEGDDSHNLIECDKGNIRLRIEWEENKFSSITTRPSKASDIYTLQCVGVIKNIISTKKWVCEREDILKLCKAVDIMVDAYSKIIKL